jgi:hypothetical protein
MQLSAIGIAAVKEPGGIITDRENVVSPLARQAWNQPFQKEATADHDSRWQPERNKERPHAATRAEGNQALLGPVPDVPRE